MESTNTFNIGLTWDGQSGAEVTIGETHTLRLDMPTEFGGLERYPCPSALFFASIGGCLLTEFLYFQKQLNFNLKGLHVDVGGNEEMSGPEGYRITRIKAAVTVKTLERDKDEAEICVELMKRYCPLTRTLENAVPIDIITQILIES
jgi:uncharacterized OsmC-like protein